MNLPAIFKILFVVLGILLSYQNCGDISLKSPDVGGDIELSSVEPTYLNPPESKHNYFRAVFFVDMSASVQAGPCLESVETWEPNGITPKNCTEPSGTDISLNRLNAIKKWVNEAHDKLLARGLTDPEHLKVYIIPFSNGRTIDMTHVLNHSTFKITKEFTKVDYGEVDKVIDSLKFIQTCFHGDCQRSPGIGDWYWSQGHSQRQMGTSVPGPGLIDVRSEVVQEVNKLRSEDKLSSSHFEFMFLSDGLGAPKIEHIKKVADVIWREGLNKAFCANQCQNALVSYLSGGSIFNINDTCRECIVAMNNYNKLTGEGYYTQVIPHLKNKWGDFFENRMEILFSRLNDIRIVFMSNPEASFRFNFILVDAEEEDLKISEYEKSPEQNWITKAQEVYSSGSHRSATIQSDVLPFALFPSMSSGRSYRLAHLFVTNLNVRTKIPNQVLVDSSGNGLPDVDEQAMGFNPKMARTNGICLDSIVALMGGCVTEFCDPTVDMDGDGLNQCEEKTLGTSDYDMDTSGDGIPDSMAVVMGYNPLKNNRLLDSNNNGISNFMQFQMGLGPLTNYNLFETKDLVSYRADFVDHKMVENSYGEQVLTTGYKVAFKVPLRHTQKVNDAGEENFFLGLNQDAGTNTILIYAKIQNTQNQGDFYWIGMKKEIDVGLSNELVEIDLSKLKPLDVLDPSWESF